MNNANIGFLFQREYYKGLTTAILNDSSKNKDLQNEFFKTKNDRIVRASKRKIEIENPVQGDNVFTLSLKTIYPGLVTGIGMVHESGMQGEGKLGMAFDHTTGLPYIPGSSVKGLLRSMFPIVSSQRKNLDKKTKMLIDEKRQYVFEILKKREGLHTLEPKDLDEIANLVFEGQLADKSYLPMYERDVFFDAQIEGDYMEKGFLGFDYITPHVDPLKNPKPIKFLKILPEVKFIFYFKLHNSKLSSGRGEISAKDKLALFKEILTTVGIGAKTNVGYGQLK